MEEKMFKAIEKGDKQQLLEAIQKGADVNTHEQPNNTPLMHAAKNGCAEIVRILIQRGADVNGKNKDGVTALMRAASNGKIDALNILLNAKADVNAVTDSTSKSKALHWAVEGHLSDNSFYPNLEGHYSCYPNFKAHYSQCIKALIQRGSSLKLSQNTLITDFYDYLEMNGLVRYITNALYSRILEGYKNKGLEAEDFEVAISFQRYMKGNKKLQETVELFNKSSIEQVSNILVNAKTETYNSSIIIKDNGTEKTYDVVRKLKDEKPYPNQTLGNSDISKYIGEFFTSFEFLSLAKVTKPSKPVSDSSDKSQAYYKQEEKIGTGVATIEKFFETGFKLDDLIATELMG